jgi:hypothetical protein
MTSTIPVPTKGTWKSTNGFPPVTVSAINEYKEAEGYFLVSVTVEGDPMDLELDPDEWEMFTRANALKPA